MNVLTLEQLNKNVPSVFANTPSTLVSDKYIFLNTANILKIFAQHEWDPCGGREAKTRNPQKQGKQKHLIRLRKASFDFKINDLIPEIILKNSHDRSCSLDFFLGLFNVVCENGLIVERLMFDSLHIRHIKVDDITVQKAIETTMISFDSISNDILRYQNIILEEEQSLAFAQSAHILMKLKKEIPVPELLKVNHNLQSSPTLWNIFNIVQENIIKGGVNYKADKRHTTTREVQNIEKEVIWNTQLWKLLQFYGRE